MTFVMIKRHFSLFLEKQIELLLLECYPTHVSMLYLLWLLLLRMVVKKKHISIDIAVALEIPSPFLSKILKVLSHENHVSSTKDPGGEFYLTEFQMKRKVLDIVNCSNGLD